MGIREAMAALDERWDELGGPPLRGDHVALADGRTALELAAHHGIEIEELPANSPQVVLYARRVAYVRPCPLLGDLRTAAGVAGAMLAGSAHNRADVWALAVAMREVDLFSLT